MYAVVITSGTYENKTKYHNADKARAAFEAVCNRQLSRGFELCDEGEGNNWKARLYCRNGYEDRNIEMYQL